MTEQELLTDCLERLNSAHIAYMLTGSMASNYWGIPRSTHDLDFVIELPPRAVPEMVAAFERDFFIDERAVRSAYQPPHQFNAIDKRSSLKVDFWLPADQAFEREMFSRRVQRTLFGIRAWIATPEDVILHKLYWDKLTPSERQQNDAAGVFRIQCETLDRAYLRQWATVLGVEAALGLLFEGKLKPKTT
jgi:hypothetical protein